MKTVPVSKQAPTLDQMLARLKGYKMSLWEKRAQSIDWAVGQVLCMRNGSQLDEWMLRLTVAKALEQK